MQILRKSRLSVTTAGLAVITSLALTSCSDDGRSEDGTPTENPTASVPTELSSVKDVPGVTMIDQQDPWPRYTTAEITEVEPGAGGKTITVNYASGPDICSGFAGYAVNRTDSTAQVTVITGMTESCKGEDTHRTTVLPLPEPLGDLTPEISRYSESAIPVS